MWLPDPCLALVTDRRLCRDDADLARRVARAVAGGVALVQLREKDLPGGPLLRLAERLRQATEGRALLFVNERADVALACGADGVHLGEEALPLAAVRRLAGDRLRIGRSVHSVEGAVAAASAEGGGADLLLVGTIFPSGSHPGAPAAGVGLLEAVAQRVTVPFLAIGGVTAENAPQVTRAGARGAAVITAVLAAFDPEAAARRLLAALREGREARRGTLHGEAHR